MQTKPALPAIKTVQSLPLHEIRMRDPFIFPYPEEGQYYLYGTTSVCDGAADIEPHFEVWHSDDLVTFHGPYVAFNPPEGYWGSKHYWAPEVHRWQDSFYLLGSFRGGIGVHRGTASLKADHPAGPYKPCSPAQLTPQDHEGLDGTLYVDGEGNPWLAYCHEWTQAYYGRIDAVRLCPDLRAPIPGTTVTIVDTKKDELPWLRKMYDPRVEKEGYLTDAPFLHKNPDGSLSLLWSSYSVPGWQGGGQGGYVVAQALSPSGKIEGPWRHLPHMLLDEDAGHAAIFKDFDGNLRLVCHYPDTRHGLEHPVLYTVEQQPGGLTINKIQNGASDNGST